ncbi:hypothetical protein GCM10010182_71300 [Actinomadura cremea]|nr:hypothetical protein GCM10010182_71300 [Actinomadura cremea]
MLELYTRRLHTDRSMLEEYLLYIPDPPETGPDAVASGDA